MAITTVHCHVLQGQVTVIIDLERRIDRVICSQYEHPSGVCRLKRDVSSGGPLSQLLERASEATLDSRSTQCQVGA
jgi:hypothetical protein